MTTDAAPPSTTGTAEELWALADRLFAAIEAGDIDAVDGLYDEDVRVWSNTDPREMDVKRSLNVLRWLTSRLANRRYDIRRRELLPDGFLQEHTLRGTAPDGTEIAMPACLIVTVRDGKILRIHEYLDPSQVASLTV